MCFHLPLRLEIIQEIVTDTLRCIANGAVERNVQFILEHVASSDSRKWEFVRIKLVCYGMVVVGINV